MDWKISWSKSESKAGERERERERERRGGGGDGSGSIWYGWADQQLRLLTMSSKSYWEKKKKILLRHWGKGERCLKLVRPVKTLLVERFNCRLREVPSSFKVERFWRLNWAVIGPGLWLGRSDHLLWPTFKIVPLNLLRYRKIE